MVVATVTAQEEEEEEKTKNINKKINKPGEEEKQTNKQTKNTKQNTSAKEKHKQQQQQHIPSQFSKASFIIKRWGDSFIQKKTKKICRLFCFCCVLNFFVKKKKEII